VGETAVIETEGAFGGKTFYITHTGLIYQGKKAVLEIFQDITERKNMEDALRGLSIVDPLTNLYNRRGFFTLAEQQCKVSQRRKMPFSIIFIDVDNMKNINDKEGHL
jgi:PleD family two-component response regulator